MASEVRTRDGVLFLPLLPFSTVVAANVVVTRRRHVAIPFFRGRFFKPFSKSFLHENTTKRIKR